MNTPIELGVLLLLLFSLPVCADDGVVPDLSQGDRIRIVYDTTLSKRMLLFIPYSLTEERSIAGQFDSITTDSIAISSIGPKGKLRHHHATSEIKKLYVSVGKKRATWKGMLYGAGTGGVLALVSLGPHAISGDELSRADPVNPLAVLGICVTAGATIGGFVGSFVYTDRWREVPRENWPHNRPSISGRARQSIRFILKF